MKMGNLLSANFPTAKFKLPADMRAGKYYVGAVADPDEVIGEENENNNMRMSTKG